MKRKLEWALRICFAGMAAWSAVHNDWTEALAWGMVLGLDVACAELYNNIMQMHTVANTQTARLRYEYNQLAMAAIKACRDAQALSDMHYATTGQCMPIEEAERIFARVGRGA